jgi:hypothetical protein
MWPQAIDVYQTAVATAVAPAAHATAKDARVVVRLYISRPSIPSSYLPLSCLCSNQIKVSVYL